MVADDSTKAPSTLTVASLSKAQRRKLQALSSKYEAIFTLGVLNMMITTIIAVRFPAHYWIWHMARTNFYLPVRFWRFQKRKWGLYLLDWCYVVTYLSTICSMLAFLRVTFGIETPLVRYNSDLIRAGFAMACGPLAWSIYVFRNSIVFHDVDHSTSVFIHLSPCLLFWCLRWGAGHGPQSREMFNICESDQEYRMADECMSSFQGLLWCNSCSAPLSAFVVPPALLYICVWAVPYFLVIFVWGYDWCKRTERETLYSYFVQSQPGMNAFFERNLQGLFGRKLAGPVGYMLFHFVSTIVVAASSYVLWHSFVLHTLVLALILVKGIHNGSTYMFRVFAYRFAEGQLEKYRDRLE